MRKELLALILASTACAGSTNGNDLREVARLKAKLNRDLDLLFVVDNSMSMADKQASLAAAFPTMMDVLGTVDGGLPNLHIGVVTSDMGSSTLHGVAGGVGTLGTGGCGGVGDDGVLVQGANIAGRYIVDVADGAGGRERNYEGALRDAFGELAAVGENGCGFEQHLAAMRRALTQPANDGFLRPEANLAIVFLADEDDCSGLDPMLFAPDGAVLPDVGSGSGSGSGTGAGTSLGHLDNYRCARFGWECDEPLTEDGPKTNCHPRADSPLVEDTAGFVDALRATKPDPSMVMVAGIVGDPAPVDITWGPTANGSYALGIAHSCATTSSVGESYVADPAVRIDAFISAFGDLGTTTSICDGDFVFPLADIAHTAKRMIADPCLDTTQLADASAAPGVQPTCELADVRAAAPDASTALPPCAGGDGDCYELVEDRVACPETSDHLRVAIRRATQVSDDTWTRVACAVR